MTQTVQIKDSSGQTRIEGSIVPGPTFTRAYAFTYTTNGLSSGVTIYTPAVGDIITDIGVAITTAFDGTTPKLDVGTFNGGNVGLFGELAGAAVDGTKVYGAVTDNAGISSANDALWLSSAVISVGAAGTAAISSWQLLVTAANPILLVASQSGQKGGTAIDSTAGAGTVYITTCTPG